MDDEAADIGTTDPATMPAGLDLSIDSAARDVEFTLFYLSDLPRLVAFLSVQGARPEDAADIAQYAMTEAFRQWDTIDVPRSWVRTVAARKWWRRDRTEVPMDDVPEPGTLLPAETSAEIENRHTFLAIVRNLPPVQRQVMAWTYDGYRPTEIAAQLGMEPAAVRSALRDARATLRRRYESTGETR